jgi:hypothetical protein
MSLSGNLRINRASLDLPIEVSFLSSARLSYGARLQCSPTHLKDGLSQSIRVFRKSLRIDQCILPLRGNPGIDKIQRSWGTLMYGTLP